MEFTYETHGSRTYLVYAFKDTDEIDTLSRGMLTYNEIPGLAKTMYSQMDSVRYLRYDVSAKVPISQFFTSQINRKRLVGIFSGIVNAMLSAEDYMIDPRSLIMDLDYMYTDVSTCETVMICVPVINDELKTVNYSLFFKDIIYRLQYDQTENLDHIAKIINYINSAPVFSFEDFRKVLDSISVAPSVNIASKADRHQTDEGGSGQQPSVVTKTKESLNIDAWKQEMKNVQPLTGGGNAGSASKNTTENSNQLENIRNGGDEKPNRSNKLKILDKLTKKIEDISDVSSDTDDMNIPGDDVLNTVITEKSSVQPSTPTDVTVVQPTVIKGNYGDTIVLSADKYGVETTVLSTGNNSSNVVPKPYLIRIKNQEKILIDKPVFRIGKEKSYVDYFIGDNSAISRSHANIIVRDGAYYVMDTNSTNHTYVNGNMIQSQTETKISSGSKLKFANEEFEFRLC